MESLLDRLEVCETESRDALANKQSSTPQAHQHPNPDPRSKMMKEIEAVLDGLWSCGVEGEVKDLAGIDQDDLSVQLKNDFCTWGGSLYAISIDKLTSTAEALTEQVQTLTASEQAFVDRLADIHKDFGRPLSDSSTQLNYDRTRLPAGSPVSLGEEAAAFQKSVGAASEEIDGLWEEWHRCVEEESRSAKVLAEGGLDGQGGCAEIIDEFKKFVKDELEAFGQLCDVDGETMEELELDFKEQLQSQISVYLKGLINDL